jgi:hypothetical protein
VPAAQKAEFMRHCWHQAGDATGQPTMPAGLTTNGSGQSEVFASDLIERIKPAIS